MTKEEIEQYIDLDNKIKNRIVQISHALNGISGTSIRKFVPDFRYWNLETYDKEDFIENSSKDKELHLGLECYDDGSWVCHFDKRILMLSDFQVNEIVEYDSKEKEDLQRRREEEDKKQKEKDEYELYLKLKKKFEKQ